MSSLHDFAEVMSITLYSIDEEAGHGTVGTAVECGRKEDGSFIDVRAVENAEGSGMSDESK